MTTLARAVTLEALGLGASVAGGADFVLRGGSGSGSDHPAGKAQTHERQKSLINFVNQSVSKTVGAHRNRIVALWFC